MDFNTLVKTYGAIGAGGLALLVLVWLLVYMVTKIKPILENLASDSKVNTEIIRNNTEAIREVSKSNDNVATALKLLNLSFETFASKLDKHDDRAEHIENEIIKISENAKRCPKQN